jgi:hypothetical protein
MKRKFTSKMLKLLATAVLFAGAFDANATFNPVAVTGFNEDVVANGIGAASTSTTADVDGVSYAFVASDFQATATSPTPTYYLPVGGVVNSVATSGLSFQLASYSGNNALRIAAQNGTGTLTFNTAQQAGEIYVLGVSGSGSSTADITVTFTDNTTETFTGITFNDWYYASGFAIQGIGRVKLTTNALEGTASDPRLYQIQLSLSSTNYSKTVASISFTKTNSGGVLIIMGIATNDVCGGTPSAGTAFAPSAVCSGASFTLSDTAYTSSAGVSFQWQESPAGAGVWSDILGATSASYTISAGITAPTDYHLIVTCSNGGATDMSNDFSVGLNAAFLCYCTPGGYTFYTSIDSVATTGATGNLSNASTGYGSTANGYSDYFPSDTLTVGQGAVFSLFAHSSSSSYWAAWIDWNGDGNFSTAGDTVMYLTSSGSSTISTNITVPVSASPGMTKLRLMAVYYTFGSTGPCGTGAYGEYEDYAINIIPTASCGAPGSPALSGGTAYAPGAVCGNASFMLTDTAYAYGPGITYQWQESPSGAGVWSDILGATSPIYTVSAGITTPMDYQLVVICTNGGASDISNTITVNINPFYNCYCIPVSNCTNEGIDSVSFDALSNTSAYCATSGYTDYGSMGSLATVTQAQVIPMAVKAHINSNPASVGVWIDYDHSGTFDASEYTSLGSSSGISPLPSEYIFSGNIVIPTSAQTGITRMRVRSANQGGITATSSCNTGTVYGEYEDYLITINAGTTCSGTPIAGTVTGSSTACAGGIFTLTASGFTNGVLGLNYEWQVFDIGTGSWIPATGGINNTTSYTDTVGVLVPTDYRFAVTCTNGGGQDFSSAFTVTPSVVTAFPFVEDFEPTSTTRDCWKIINANNDGDAWSFTNSSTYAHSGTYKAEIYTDFNSGANDDWLITPAITLTGNQILKYWYRARSSSEPNDYEIRLSTTGSSPTDFTTVLKPLTSASNTTYQKDSIDLSTYTGTVFIAFHLPPGGLDGYYFYIDDVSVEDLPPQCAGTPVAGTIYGPDSVCAGIPFTLIDTAYTVAQGITLQWESSPAGLGMWTPILGATNPTYVVATGITTPTDYHVIATCANAGSADVTNTISIGIYPPTQCYCIPSGTSSGYGIQSFATTGGYTNINNVNSGTSANGYGNFTNMVLSASQSGTINFTTSFVTGTNGFAVFIDWGQDGSFAEAGDLVYNTTGYQSSPLTGSFTVPSAAISGNTRMRIVSTFNTSNPSSDYCTTSTSSSAEWEDYTFSVVAPPTCTPPSGLAATNTAATSTDLSWTENGTATQWSIEYGPTGFTQGTGTFVSTTSNPYTLSGLSSVIAYDIYVKSICSATDSSLANGPVSINTLQIPVSSYPYAANWDNGNGGWTYTNGSQANKWFVGAPGDNPAYATGATPGGLYISNDGGVTNGYNTGSSSIVHAYRDLDLSSFSSAVPLTFNSYVVGEANLPNIYDYLSVWVVPISYEPVPGTNLNSVGSATQIGGNIVLETGWTQHLLNIPASATGSTVRLVLQWRNDGSSGSAPVRVDNLTIGGFPLVIKLKDINATNLGAKNRVDWSTESELKSDKFELERSADGRNFTYLATIKAKGEASNYSYVDLSPVTGVNYYRLKMIDAAGAVATSKVVTATVKQGVFTVEAYPNPVSEKLTVQVYGGSDQNATVSITDVTGKVMKVVSVVNGKAEVNMNGLASGVYLVKYTDNNHSQTIKVNKQ